MNWLSEISFCLKVSVGRKGDVTSVIVGGSMCMELMSGGSGEEVAMVVLFILSFYILIC